MTTTCHRRRVLSALGACRRSAVAALVAARSSPAARSARTHLLTIAALAIAATSARAEVEVGSVRIRGTRYVAGVEQRIDCSAYAFPPNRWYRDASGLRRFELAASCPLADDLAGVLFAGAEDAVVWHGFLTRRSVVVATVSGALHGAVSAELRRRPYGSFGFERGRLVYHLGPVTFVGEYKVRCDPSAGACGP